MKDGRLVLGIGDNLLDAVLGEEPAKPEPAPDPSNPGWQMQAWIDLERQRYQI